MNPLYPPMPLRITHIAEDYSASAGGVPAVVNQLAKQSAALGAETEIVFVREDPLPAPPGVRLKKVKPKGLGAFWGWSGELKGVLYDSLADTDMRVAHLHGIWMAPQWIGARIATELQVPVVLSDHGMLDPWLWDYKGTSQHLKKWLYWNAIAYPVFHHAAVIHALTPRHREILAGHFPGQRIEMIPNAIDLIEIDNALTRISREKEVIQDRFILFIGRLDPQKGIDLLINAFARTCLPSNWKLVIAGPEKVGGYRSFLESMAKQEGVTGCVTFVGPVHGDDKWRLYHQAWVVVTPSRFEAMGLVNLEAAACGTPVITTFEAGPTDLDEGGGLLVNAQVDELTRAIRQACAWSDNERNDRGKAGRNLIAKRYNWEVVIHQWFDLYRSLLT